MKTKYGNAKIKDEGYYRITSSKESNYGKLLHRLIARDYFGDWIDEPLIDGEKIEIHHIDGNPLNNCVLNLLPLPRSEHLRLHHNGKKHSEESKQKMSYAHNTTGYYRVSKHKNKRYKQGFIWLYRYFVDGKQKSIYSVDIKKLEKKVKAKGLKWRKIS